VGAITIEATDHSAGAYGRCAEENATRHWTPACLNQPGRQARQLGIPTPYNDALSLLLKGVEKHHAQTVRGPAIDYDRLEAKAATEHH
jgi:hypothetical protein